MFDTLTVHYPIPLRPDHVSSLTESLLFLQDIIWMQYNKRSYRLETSLKYHFVALKLIQQSSSLRMIGIRSCISNRITPACAGKRCSPYLCFWGVIDHPCVCREKIVEPCNILAPAGSPLRVQGKVILFGCIDWRYRITPAWAGKSAEKIIQNN